MAIGHGGARPGAGRSRVGEPSRILTAEPLPRNRHVALAIRDYIQREGLSLSAFSRLVGASTTTSHAWAKGTGAVDPQFRPAVAHLLGVPAAFLEPWDGKGDPPDMTPTAEAPQTELGPARTARALVATLPAAPPALGGRLSYEGHGDGTATIAVRARLPLSQAKPLFRLLMDSGIDLEGGSSDDPTDIRS